MLLGLAVILTFISFALINNTIRLAKAWHIWSERVDKDGEQLERRL